MATTFTKRETLGIASAAISAVLMSSDWLILKEDAYRETEVYQSLPHVKKQSNR